MWVKFQIFSVSPSTSLVSECCFVCTRSTLYNIVTRTVFMSGSSLQVIKKMFFKTSPSTSQFYDLDLSGILLYTFW